MNELAAGQVRRSPDGNRWRVLGEDVTRAGVVGLEKLTPPAAGLGYFRPVEEVRRWPLVAMGEVA